MSHSVTCHFNRIDTHPADCQCDECLALNAELSTLNTNFSQLILDTLTPSHTATANGGEASAASSGIRLVSRAGGLKLVPARGGVVRTAHSPVQSPRAKVQSPGEAAVITSARPVVVKEILSILGRDIPDPLAHAKYLDTLPFANLCARRDQLKQEQQEQLEREELSRQPEFFTAENTRSAKV